MLSHVNEQGEARMVSVADKLPTRRSAIAQCDILMKAETFRLLRSGDLPKGDAFTVAKTAGILAAKKTSELVPLCHPLAIEHVEIHFIDRPEEDGFTIQSEVLTTAKTGVEMEALTAVMIVALTFYDMAKSSDPGMRISDIHLVQKTGGKSDYSLSSCDSHGQ